MEFTKQTESQKTLPFKKWDLPHYKRCPFVASPFLSAPTSPKRKWSNTERCIIYRYIDIVISKPTCKKNLVRSECMCRTRRRVGEGWSTRAASWTTGVCTTSGHKIKTLPRHNGPKAWVLSAKKLILSYVDQNSASESRPHFNFEILAKLQVQNLNPLFSQQCNGAFQHCPS